MSEPKKDDGLISVNIDGTDVRCRPGENIIEQNADGVWVERAHFFEAVAVTGDGVFDTLKAVSKLVLKTLA